MSKDIDHEYTADLVCPYCGHEHGDDGEMNEDGQHQCGRCEKHFKYDVHYFKHFTSKKVPCLNGEPHKEKRYDYTPQKDMFSCTHCGRYRYEDRKAEV